MHALGGMATITHDVNLHDHAGARWLALIVPAMLAVTLIILAMMIYPHVG